MRELVDRLTLTPSPRICSVGRVPQAGKTTLGRNGFRKSAWGPPSPRGVARLRVVLRDADGLLHTASCANAWRGLRGLRVDGESGEDYGVAIQALPGGDRVDAGAKPYGGARSDIRRREKAEGVRAQGPRRLGVMAVGARGSAASGGRAIGSQLSALGALGFWLTALTAESRQRGRRASGGRLTRSVSGDLARPRRYARVTMELDRRACDRARRARDARFDGRFFIAVTSTRHLLPADLPGARAEGRERPLLPDGRAAAEAAGYPSVPALPARSGARHAGVARHLERRVARAAADRRGRARRSDGVDGLAERLGVTARHLRRLFLRHLGATPLDVAHDAPRPFRQEAARRNDAADARGRARRRLRQRAALQQPDAAHLHAHADRAAAAGAAARRRRRRALSLPTQPTAPPYDWDVRARLPRARATPGVEAVADGRYRRTHRGRRQTGEHRRLARRRPALALALEVAVPDPRALLVDRRTRAAHVRSRRRSGRDRRAPRRRSAARRGCWPRIPASARRARGTASSWRCARCSASRSRCARATTLAGRDRDRCSGAPRRRLDARLDRLFPTPARARRRAARSVGVMPCARRRRSARWRAACATGRSRSTLRAPTAATWPRCARFPASATGRRSTSPCARSASPMRFSLAISSCAAPPAACTAASSTPLRGVAAVARLRRDAAVAGATVDHRAARSAARSRELRHANVPASP